MSSFFSAYISGGRILLEVVEGERRVREVRWGEGREESRGFDFGIGSPLKGGILSSI